MVVPLAYSVSASPSPAEDAAKDGAVRAGFEHHATPATPGVVHQVAWLESPAQSMDNKIVWHGAVARCGPGALGGAEADSEGGVEGEAGAQLLAPLESMKRQRTHCLCGSQRPHRCSTLRTARRALSSSRAVSFRRSAGLARQNGLKPTGRTSTDRLPTATTTPGCPRLESRTNVPTSSASCAAMDAYCSHGDGRATIRRGVSSTWGIPRRLTGPRCILAHRHPHGEVVRDWSVGRTTIDELGEAGGVR